MAHVHIELPVVSHTVASHTPFPEQSVSLSHATSHFSPINPKAHEHLRRLSTYSPPFSQYASRTAPVAGSLSSHSFPVCPGGHSHSAVMSLHVPPNLHAHVLHPWPIYPPLHTHAIAEDATSNTQLPRDSGQVPAAHVAATHTPPTPVAVYPSSHAHCASSDPAAGGHTPRPPHKNASAESGSAANAGGPAPGQNKSQSAPVHPSRQEHVVPVNLPVHTCISAPEANLVSLAMPHSHVGVTSCFNVLQSTPSNPGLQ